MPFKKRVLSVILAGVLALALLTTGALAADFTRIRTYTPGQFIDVAENAWYAASVRDAYELGLMSGTGDDTFSPAGMFTLSQALTVAGRMHSIYSGGDGNIPSVTGDWQKDALSYCVQNGIVRKGQFDDYFRNATRAEMAQIMEAALPDSAWSAINSVEELPDVSTSTDGYQAIFRLYNAGVFSGSDEYGMFQPYASITRAEVAAIVSRCAQPAQRLKLNLKPLSEREAPVIPGYIPYDPYVISSGRMRIRDADTRLYGYIDGTGAVKIPTIYSEARDFTPYGYAAVREQGSDWGIINTSGEYVIPLVDGVEDLGYGAFDVRKDGKHGIVVNGQLKTDTVYDQITTNGIYLFGRNSISKSSDYTYDVFDMGGNKLSSFTGQLRSTEGSSLLRIKSGNKYALALGRGEITEYLYDNIDLHSNSNLAELWSGSMQALAGENGIIFDLNEHVYRDIDGGFAKVSTVSDEGTKISYVVDATGKASGSFVDLNHDLLLRDCSENGMVVVCHGLYGVFDVIDAVTGEVFPTANHEFYGQLEDGTFCILDGTICENLEVKDNRERYATFQVDGKYGFSYKGVTVSEPVYDTEEEAIAAYGFYKIDTENGKPVVLYGNDIGGFTHCIQYYKNNLYYDEILDVGEGYYACRFDRTWYLLHV